jgi:hypothetical protein
VVAGKGIGHIKPVCAVVRAGIAVGHPRQSTPIVFDGGEEAGEEAGHVSRFLHVCIIPHSRQKSRGQVGFFVVVSPYAPRV